jgi:hypothetical protein
VRPFSGMAPLSLFCSWIMGDTRGARLTVSEMTTWLRYWISRYVVGVSPQSSSLKLENDKDLSKPEQALEASTFRRGFRSPTRRRPAQPTQIAEMVT